ncbi:MAG: hypothetical protein IT352_07540 [Gemmatimonadales bacterium]|nr:hypothetical protein [Gemmatimonadales bacterium]
MAFDVDAWLEAQTPWTVTIRRRRYHAEPVSVLAVFAFQKDVEALKGTTDTAGYQRAVERLLREAFPYRWRMLLPWHGDPVRRILALRPDAQQAVLRDFFEWTATRLGVTGSPTTPGSNSDAPTPRRTTAEPGLVPISP